MLSFSNPKMLAVGCMIFGSLVAGDSRAEMVIVAGYVPTPPRDPRTRLMHVANHEAGTVCTQEVRACPDGSSVARNPAHECQFKPCPATASLN